MKNKNTLIKRLIALILTVCALPIITVTFFNLSNTSTVDRFVKKTTIKNNSDTSLGKNFHTSIDSTLMPKSRGYGNLHSWHTSLTLDNIILQMAQDMVTTNPKDIYLINDKFEDFLFRWANVEDATVADVYKSISPLLLFYPNKIAFVLEPKKMAFLERITGEDFLNANIASIAAAERSWNMFFNEFLNRFLVQGPLHKIFPNSYYDFAIDKLMINNTLDDVMVNAQTIATSMDSDSFTNYMRYVKNLIKLNKTAFNDPDFDTKIEKILDYKQ